MQEYIKGFNEGLPFGIAVALIMVIIILITWVI